MIVRLDRFGCGALRASGSDHALIHLFACHDAHCILERERRKEAWRMQFQGGGG